MAQSSISKIFSTTFLLVLMFMMSHTAESGLLKVDITKANVGHNGNIVKVKPTHVSVAKKGEGLARVDTQGVNVGKHGSIAKVGEANVFVAQKGSTVLKAFPDLVNFHLL
ncbi:hypothetical protein MKW98_018268 [Papaver atlanticum]|uniref:Uncharacterized protein n=1 Tax=Papaver atlanticum TaxID=357466 RepID=A0AAD4X8V5_9MAGN|nr:hypothetical protein MKW98_018268 [Papaver atlanticum]